MNNKSKYLFIVASILFASSLIIWVMGSGIPAGNWGASVLVGIASMISLYISVWFFITGLLCIKNRIVGFTHVLIMFLLSLIIIFLRLTDPLEGISEYIIGTLLFIPIALLFGIKFLPLREDDSATRQTKIIRYLLIQLVIFGAISLIFPFDFLF